MNCECVRAYYTYITTAITTALGTLPLITMLGQISQHRLWNFCTEHRWGESLHNILRALQHPMLLVHAGRGVRADQKCGEENLICIY